MTGQREGNTPSCLDCTEEVVVAGLYNGCILVYTSDVGDLMAICSRHMGPVTDVMTSVRDDTNADSFLVSGSADCSVRLWNLLQGLCLHVFRDSKWSLVSKGLLLLDTRIFALGTAYINVWSYPEKTLLKVLKPVEGSFQPGLVGCHTVDKGAPCCVVVCGSSQGFYVWSAASYELLRIVCSEGYLPVQSVVGMGSAFIAVTSDEGLALISSTTGHHVTTVKIPQFNSAHCGIWLNKSHLWLNGTFEKREQPLFVVSNLAGEICSFYLTTLIDE